MSFKSRERRAASTESRGSRSRGGCSVERGVQGQVAGARLAAQARWTEAGHLALTLGLGEVGDLATQMVTKGLAKATYSH